MTDKVKEFLAFHRKREYRKTRRTIDFEKIEPEDLNMWPATVMKQVSEAEDLRLYPQDIFGFNRSVANLPDLKGFHMGNITPDYPFALKFGLGGMTNELRRLKSVNPDKAAFYDGAIAGFEALEKLAARQADEAEKQGNTRLTDGIRAILSRPPHDYYEALLTQRAMTYLLRVVRMDHVTMGRFDKYMYPFFLKSLEEGATKDELLEMTELYFISLNLDTDIYSGIQQGDNGQSLVLGGRTKESEDIFNDLSEIVLCASEELCLIDPKINVRVNKNTPLSRYERCTRLTAKGLGFPQYSNDDVVIKGLTDLGYDYDDAVEYTMAACWEFIVPYVAYDIVNIRTMNFPKAVRQATIDDLKKCKDFEEFFACANKQVDAQFAEHIEIAKEHAAREIYPNPVACAFITPCREKGIDRINGGAKYNNYGLHGLGIAPAVDALAAIKTRVFEEKSITKDDLIAALEANFEGWGELRSLLLSSPKMGNNEDVTNDIAVRLMDHFASVVNGTPNGKKGAIWRAGTGGSMDYVYMARGVGATADGRKADEPYPSSFSPSIGVKANGLISVISSFTKPNLVKTVNGGPLTIEIHETVFNHPDGIPKVAMLVQNFIRLGGHQLQLNAIAREKLLDAQAHPENYPDLIVRVWGWSGYFNELDLCFQNQIISRTEYGI